MIVKVQRSMYPDSTEVLIYNESREFMWTGIMDKAVSKWLGNRLKAYAFAHVQGKELIVDDEAPEQDW